MPPKSRKRKLPLKPENDHLAGLPESTKRIIQELVQSLRDRTENSREEQVKHIIERSEKELDFTHLDFAAILDVLLEHEGPERTSILEKMFADAYRQTSRAHRVFALLDTAGKGVVVLEDLARACGEVEQKLELDDLEEMISMFAGDDGLLTKDDLVKIAREVGL